MANLLSYYQNGPYIHSNVDNYLAVSKWLPKTSAMNQIRDTIIPIFNKLIERAKFLENQFYIDMDASSANDFSRKYLLLGEINEDSHIIKKIGSILNTEEFRDILLNSRTQQEKLDKIIEEKLIKNSNTEIFKDLAIEEGHQLLLDILSQKKLTREITMKKLQIPSLKVALRGKMNTEAYRKYVTELGLTSTSIQEGLDKEGKKYDNALLDRAKNYLITGLVKLKVDQEQAEHLGTNLRNTLAKIMLERNGHIGEINIFTNPKGATGFVAEVVWSFDKSLTGIESKVIGSQRYTKGPHKGQQVGSDIRIKGKHSGTIYFIQSKNTFYSQGPMYQGGGDLNTVLNRISQKSSIFSSEEEIKLLKYNILNSKFLNVKDRLGQISELLNTGILHFLKVQNIEALERNLNEKAGNISNLFYIYKGTHLIPISDFLTIARDLMSKENQPTGLFNITFNDIIMDAGEGEQEDFKKDKNIIKILNPEVEPGQYSLGNYSEDMLSLGISKGEYLASHTEIRNIKILAKEIQMLIEQAAKTVE